MNRPRPPVPPLSRVERLGFKLLMLEIAFGVGIAVCRVIRG